MCLRSAGLLDSVEIVLVPDRDVGRWRQWSLVSDGSCVAAFIRPLYLQVALEAGLKVMPRPTMDMVDTYAQACRADLPDERPEEFDGYLKGVVHAFHLIKHDWPAALDIANGEPRQLMGISDVGGMERTFRIMAGPINERPFPTREAVANAFEVATQEYPDAAGVEPWTIWDTSYLDKLAASGFFATLPGGGTGA